MINTNTNPFFICKQPRPTEDHIRQFEQRLDIYRKQKTKVLFNDVKQTRALMGLLLRALGDVKHGLFGFYSDDKPNSIKHLEGLLKYLMNETDQLPEGCEHWRTTELGHGLRTELSILLDRPVRFGEKSAEKAIDILELLLTQLQQVDQQYKPRPMQSGVVKCSMRRRTLPAQFPRNLIREIASYLPSKDQLSFGRIDRKNLNALLPNFRCAQVASIPFYDKRTFELASGCLRESWALQEHLKAAALTGWAAGLGRGKVRDAKHIFSTIKSEIQGLPERFRAEPLTALIKSVAGIDELRGRSSQQTGMLIDMVEELPAHLRKPTLEPLLEVMEPLKYGCCNIDSSSKHILKLAVVVEQTADISSINLKEKFGLLCRRIFEKIWLEGDLEHLAKCVAEFPEELLFNACHGFAAARITNYQSPRDVELLMDIPKKILEFNVNKRLSKDQCLTIFGDIEKKIRATWANQKVASWRHRMTYLLADATSKLQ
jgi:hypothetical protein